MKPCIFFCFCCIIFLAGHLHAQQNHFIYLQTENRQAFYLKLDNNILSSSASGYLIVPKLNEGIFDFTIGFPKKEWSEQKFSCKVANADAGYLVKNFGDKGWGLFNLQTLDITMAGMPGQQQLSNQGDKTDEFSRLLSNAVNDPSILKKDIVEPAAVAKDTVKPVAAGKRDLALPVQKVVEEKVKESNQVKPVENATDGIKKVQESTTGGETTRIYVVEDAGVADTVSISIPAVEEPAISLVDNGGIKAKTVIDTVIEKPVAEQHTADEKTGVVLAEKPVLTESTPKPADVATATPAAGKEKFLPIDMEPVAGKIDSAAVGSTVSDKKDIPETAPDKLLDKPVVVIANSDCINNASDEDFLKLRKKMASASSDEDMMNIAKKVFKQKCFSTDQIKNLGVLFLKDEGRYNFFDLAYPHVWDSSSYKSLESQLADPYFANRFKAMIRH